MRALVDVLAAWRAAKHPRIAKLVERVGRSCARPALAPASQSAMQREWIAIAEREDPADVPRLLDALVSGDSANTAVRIDKLAWAIDPRVADALAGLLVTQVFRGSFGNRPNRAAIERLAAIGDPRTAERVDGIVNPDKGAKPHPQRELVIEMVAGIAPSTAVLAGAVAEACAALEAVPGAHGDELLDAIYEHPDDDALREVYADWLIERGDPRGELISLQLRREATADVEKRVRALLRKHEKEWLGARAAMTKLREWERGFLVACKLSANVRSLRAARDSREWRTLERLEVDGATDLPVDYLWRDSFANLREIRGVSAKVAAEILVGERAWPRLERLGFRSMHAEELAPLFAREHRVPALRAVAIEQRVAVEELAPLWTAPIGQGLVELSLWYALDVLPAWLAAVGPRIERVVFALPLGVVMTAERATASRWRFVVSDSAEWLSTTVESLAAALAQLPMGAIDAIVVTGETHPALEAALAAFGERVVRENLRDDPDRAPGLSGVSR